MALCPLSMSELALLPRMPKLLLRPPVLRRISLFRFMTGVSLNGSAIVFDSAAFFAAPLPRVFSATGSGVCIAARGDNCGDTSISISLLRLFDEVPLVDLDLDFGLGFSTSFSSCCSSGLADEERLVRRVARCCGNDTICGSSWGAANWLDLLFDALFGGAGNDSSTDASRALLALGGLPGRLAAGAGAGAGATSSSGIGSGIVVFAFLVALVN